MVLSNWDESIANGRRRVFRIEIDVPSDNDPAKTLAKFHIEREFKDELGFVVARSQVATWSINLAEAEIDPITSAAALAVASGLEQISLALYNREREKAEIIVEESTDGTEGEDPNAIDAQG